MADATELSKIFRIRKTVAKMLTKRCVWALPPRPAARARASFEGGSSHRAYHNSPPPPAAESTTSTTRSLR